MNYKELFKSPKFIVLISMAINIILILIGYIWFDNNYIHLELSALLILSLLLDASIMVFVSFTCIEILSLQEIKCILNMLNTISPLIILFIFLILFIIIIYCP